MPLKPSLWALGALLCIGAAPPVVAQAVYKCGFRSYSQTPCPGSSVVNTAQAPVPVKPNPREVDVHRLAQNRALAQSLRRLPGESDAQFDKRRHRAAMLDTDRDECARLDTRMPVEKASLTNPDPEEVSKAQDALAQSRKRFHELRC